MHKAKTAPKKRIGRFNSQAKNPCRRFPKKRTSAVDFGEALALCQGYDDIVGLLCEVLGEKPSYAAIQAAWPWLERRTKLPCKCPVVHPSGLVTLCHLYDHHVTDKKDWSFARFLKWACLMQARRAPSDRPNSSRQVVARCCRCRALIRIRRDGRSRLIG